MKDEINKSVENNDEISGDADLSENAKEKPNDEWVVVKAVLYEIFVLIILYILLIISAQYIMYLKSNN